jgi:hypothetical protein
MLLAVKHPNEKRAVNARAAHVVGRLVAGVMGMQGYGEGMKRGKARESYPKEICKRASNTDAG